ncbi:MAG: hypothetical protein AAFQ82_26385, partial [Myxococcota bacterium]
MMYLLIKLLLLLVLAAFFGFLLGRWWVRRQFKDVTEEFYSLRRSGDQMNRRLDGLEDLVRETGDLKPLSTRLDDVAGAVRAIEIPKAPEPVKLDGLFA